MSSNNTKGGGGGGGKGGANEWSQAQSASQWCVGCQVTLTTTMNEVVKGEVRTSRKGSAHACEPTKESERERERERDYEAFAIC